MGKGRGEGVGDWWLLVSLRLFIFECGRETTLLKALNRFGANEIKGASKKGSPN